MDINPGIPGNYDTSVIIPCKSEHLHQLNIDFYCKNGVEIILVISKKEAATALELTRRHPFINWKILATEAEDLNYGAFVNAALPWCEKQFVLVHDPEIVPLSDYLHILRSQSNIYPNHFYIAAIENAPAIVDVDTIISDATFRCGPLLMPKQWLTSLHGCHERLQDKYTTLLNLKARLEKRGHKSMYVREAKCKYLCNQPQLDLECFRLYFYQSHYLPEMSTQQSTQLLFHWRDKSELQHVLEDYLSGYKKYELRDPNILKNQYKKILLAQCHNEISNLHNFLDNMACYFDGFILLDDDSTDGSYGHMQHEKLLIKVQKERMLFNDLENRNILLDIASFFNADWFCFMDMDERIDPRFSNFSLFEERTDIQSVIFNFVHCWKGERLYNAGIANSKNGFEIRFRMFRNLGRMQITASTKLHFPAVPFTDGKHYSNILFLHLGNKSRQLRKKKYRFYKEQDKDYDISMYGFLLNEENARLRAVKDIAIQDGKFCDTAYGPNFTHGQL